MNRIEQEALLRDVVHKATQFHATNGQLMDIAASLIMHIYRKSGLPKKEIYEYIDDLRFRLREAVDQSETEVEDIVLDMEGQTETMTNKRLRRILLDYPASMEVRIKAERSAVSKGISPQLLIEPAADGIVALMLYPLSE